MSNLIAGLDHVAITVSDVDRASEFYQRVLGAVPTGDFAPKGDVLVRSVSLGTVAINIHRLDNGVWLVADRPTPGSADICFSWSGSASEAQTYLREKGVEVIEGPSPRFTSDGRPGMSVYFKDPDGNLIELMSTTEVDHSGVDMAAMMARMLTT